MSARLTISLSCPTSVARQGRAVVCFQALEVRVEERAAWQHDHVQSGTCLRSPEQFACEPLRAIPQGGPAESPGRHDPQPVHRQVVGQNEQGQIPAVRPDAFGVKPLVLRSSPYPLVASQRLRHHRLRRHRQATTLIASGGSVARERNRGRQEAASRFRPLARRRFRIRRPAFVLIRTRNPWVRRRCRRFGWNVRFIDLSSLDSANLDVEKLQW